MADRAIVKIELNDDEYRTKDKINNNFAQLSRGLILDGNTTTIIQDAVEVDINNIVRQVFNAVYPAGNSFIFTNSLDDPRLNIGTWRRVQNRFLVAAGDDFPFNQTGGSSQVTLTVDNLPTFQVEQEPHSHTYQKASATLSNGTGASSVLTSLQDDETSEVIATNKPIGSDEPFDILPPYLAKYCFERIS